MELINARRRRDIGASSSRSMSAHEETIDQLRSDYHRVEAQLLKVTQRETSTGRKCRKCKLGTCEWRKR
ncbi:hypothetical protein Scep_015285 [Stephania cephalantha]|uniref:Uncharacterized protein n=1 Tax=Stephania cephalantha TaxID=152367 RepID=A0AAP0J2X4_9MAGN